MDISGHLFIGERPWELRWKYINDNIDFKNKRFLELGCNMSLLSVFAMKKGASKCTGIDHDRQILESAKLIAEAFETKDINYLQIDFDSEAIWESKITEHDIVSCLSVLNWVKDKDRLLKFLSNYNELIFEGHESYIKETERLEKIGFSNFKLLSKTERGRELIYSSKK